MSVTVAWDDNEQAVIRMTFNGHWENQELLNAGAQAILMVRSVQYPVYVITDYTQSGSPPIGVIWAARSLSQRRPPNWGGGIIITRDAIFKSLFEAFSYVYLLRHQQQRQFIVSSNEEALAIVARLKQQHPPR